MSKLEIPGSSSFVLWMQTTLLPCLQSPLSFAVLMHDFNKFSVPWKDGILKGITPLDTFNCLITELFVLHAKIGCLGLYLAINRAASPSSVSTMSRSADYMKLNLTMSNTKWAAAALIAAFIVTGDSVYFLISCCTSSSSVHRSAADQVLTFILRL